MQTHQELPADPPLLGDANHEEGPVATPTGPRVRSAERAPSSVRAPA